MILAVTGHRPDKLGGYSPANLDKLARFAGGELFRIQPSPAMVLTGMALGFDQAIAAACRDLSIPFVACIPHDDQEAIWPRESQEIYRELLGHAFKVIIVHPGMYAAWKMLKRDEYMLDRSEQLLALFNGDAKGGTAHTVRYAESKPLVVKVENCWERWVAFR